ncbi:hypothetical protein B0H19DRAFT_1340149 [Mycena capillaripes]|nr:hypothetical protein B0H19DRAFT_1340149 [Mycena capillaripes]
MHPLRSTLETCVHLRTGCGGKRGRPLSANTSRHPSSPAHATITSTTQYTPQLHDITSRGQAHLGAATRSHLCGTHAPARTWHAAGLAPPHPRTACTRLPNACTLLARRRAVVLARLSQLLGMAQCTPTFPAPRSSQDRPLRTLEGKARKHALLPRTLAAADSGSARMHPRSPAVSSSSPAAHCPLSAAFERTGYMRAHPGPAHTRSRTLAARTHADDLAYIPPATHTSPSSRVYAPRCPTHSVHRLAPIARYWCLAPLECASAAQEKYEKEGKEHLYSPSNPSS